MSCPVCEQEFPGHAPQCPHCGFKLSHADRAFGAVPPLDNEVTDLAGVLSDRAKKRIHALIAKVQRPFPQVQFAAVISRFPDGAPLRAITLWIFNRGRLTSPLNSGAACRLVLFVLDTNANRAACMTGYGLEPFLTGEKLTHILQTGQPALSRGAYADAISVMIENAAAELKAIAVTLPQDDAMRGNLDAAMERESEFVY